MRFKSNGKSGFGGRELHCGERSKAVESDKGGKELGRGKRLGGKGFRIRSRKPGAAEGKSSPGGKLP
jgi:hypothetical protein